MQNDKPNAHTSIENFIQKRNSKSNERDFTDAELGIYIQSSNQTEYKNKYYAQAKC